MGQTVFIPRELDANEQRVAASPDTVKRLATGSRIPDEEFAKAGAAIGKAADASKADVVLKVRRPTDAELKGYKQGAAVIAIMDPYGNDAAVAAMAKAG
ncbi:MAG: NAD(P)(+) transhydrogenase (Re/Si-specific) subunit alpha, partial [Mesorhizobium sp.]